MLVLRIKERWWFLSSGRPKLLKIVMPTNAQTAILIGLPRQDTNWLSWRLMRVQLWRWCFSGRFLQPKILSLVKFSVDWEEICC
ncbi:hypothetical protein BRADI_4g44596v3 [Brachypodium distachyon]|uniref:Uncharacterized protein n=1 Tax=Brachypodium distachyon TaxID=15368 RepID=A0A2K2CU67_BRADI|nr:hypothetical protein BRADI_4g44596v3 [Brachypodium distachyon]